MTNTEKGTNFENYIASIYAGLGYRVEKNLRKTGQQVDIIAEKYNGEIGLIRIAIECKYLSSGSVDNQTVFNFRTVINTLATSDNISRGVIITNTAFSKDAKSVTAKNNLVELITLDQLENSFFELSNTFVTFKLQYEKSIIFNNYVPLSGTETNSLLTEELMIEDVEQRIIRWTQDVKTDFLTIFGDYGAGKSTLLEKVKYVFVRKYLEGTSSIKPIIILLKDYYKYQTLDNLLYHSIVREFNREIPTDLFKNAVNEGNILLLLDGFDEMTQKIDAQVRRDNFFTLSQLLPAKAILTCRPSYFIAYQEYNTYLTEIRKWNAPVEIFPKNQKSKKTNVHKTVYNQLNNHLYQKFVGYKPPNNVNLYTIKLQTFNEQQIDSYLQKFALEFHKKYGKSWKEIKEILRQIYDIKDLMKRPILLDMIVSTILFEGFDITKDMLNIGPASLYLTYTSHYFEKDWKKAESRQLVSPNERKAFATAIAVTMLMENRLEVTYDDILKVIKDRLSESNVGNQIKNIPIEHLAADIQTCTFLTLTDAQTFKFTHKSFMEFFVADFVKALILGKRQNDIMEILFNNEIIYFLSSYCYLEEDLKGSILSAHRSYSRYDKTSVIQKRNITAVLLNFYKKLENTSFDFRTISLIDIEDNCIDALSFNKVLFESVKILNADFKGKSFKDVDFKDCNLVDSQISFDLLKCTFHGSTVENTLFLSSEHIAITFSDSSIVTSTFDAHWISLDGDATFNNCLFKGAYFFHVSVNLSLNGLHFNDCQFVNCNLVAKNITGTRFSFDKTTFKNCTLHDLCFSWDIVQEESLVDCKGWIFISEIFKERRDTPVDNFLGYNSYQRQLKKYQQHMHELEKERERTGKEPSIDKRYDPPVFDAVNAFQILNGQMLLIYEPAWIAYKQEIITHLDQHDYLPSWVRQFVMAHAV